MKSICISLVLLFCFEATLTAGFFKKKKNLDRTQEGDSRGMDREDFLRNFVLGRMELASEAIKAGNWQDAELPLDEAISSIEQVFGYDEAALKARSLWHEESSKIFKGEPYERVMVYYYRALCYVKAGDLSNARALLRSAKLQDAFAEEEQFQYDFAIVTLVDYWCGLQQQNRLDQVHLDEELSVLLEEYQVLRPGRPVPASNDNVIFLVETGNAPRKLLDGISQEKLVYRRGKFFNEEQVKIAISGAGLQDAVPVESLYYQASTRGGRAVDSIVAGKAKYKKNVTGVGAGLADLGSATIVLSGASGNASAIGGGVAVFGSAVQLIALNAKPEADNRYWKGLPDTIHCYTANLEAGDYDASFQYFDSNNQLIPELTTSVAFTVSESQPSLVWVSSR